MMVVRVGSACRKCVYQDIRPLYGTRHTTHDVCGRVGRNSNRRTKKKRKERKKKKDDTVEKNTRTVYVVSAVAEQYARCNRLDHPLSTKTTPVLLQLVLTKPLYGKEM